MIACGVHEQQGKKNNCKYLKHTNTSECQQGEVKTDILSAGGAGFNFSNRL